MFSATSAITAGQPSRAKVIENDGRCQPTSAMPGVNAWLPTRPSAVCGGKPNQSALLDPAPVDAVGGSVASVAPGSVEVIWPKTASASQEMT